MPLPGDITTRVVTGTFPDVAGRPAAGSVTFTSSAPLTDSTGKVNIEEVPQTYFLSAGAFTTLPMATTDNVNLLPAGWTYTVEIAIFGLPPRTFSVQLPAGAGSIDLSALAPVVPVASFSAFLPLSGGTESGPVTFTGTPPLIIPAGAGAGKVLTSDASGNGTWQTAAGAATPDLTNGMGLAGQTMDHQMCDTALSLGSGTLVFVLVNLSGASISKLGLWLHAAGITSGGVNGMAYYDLAGNLKDQTADMTAAFGGGVDTWQTGTLSLGSQSPAAGPYYLAALTHFTTAPQVLGVNKSFSIPAVNTRFKSVFLTAQASFPATFNPATATRNAGSYYLTASA